MGRNKFESAANRRTIFLVLPLHFFGSKITISRLGERFRDGQYSLVTFLFAVFLLTAPPCTSICKTGRVLWSRRHWIHRREKQRVRMLKTTEPTLHLYVTRSVVISRGPAEHKGCMSTSQWCSPVPLSNIWPRIRLLS